MHISCVIIIAFHAVPVKVVNLKSSIFLLCLGVNTAVAPVYLSEIAPIRLRGALGVLNQFGIVLGLLSGYILGLKQVCCLLSLLKEYFLRYHQNNGVSFCLWRQAKPMYKHVLYIMIKVL